MCCVIKMLSSHEDFLVCWGTAVRLWQEIYSRLMFTEFSKCFLTHFLIQSLEVTFGVIFFFLHCKSEFGGLVIIFQYFLSQLNFIVYLWERKVSSSAETPSPPSSSHLCNRRPCWMCQLYEPGLEIKIIGVRILLTRVEISVAKRKKSVSF